MVSLLPSCAMFVKPKVGEALEIIDSGERLGLFVHFLNYVWLWGIETLSPFAAYFFPTGSEFTVSDQAPWGLGSRSSKSISVMDEDS